MIIRYLPRTTYENQPTALTITTKNIVKVATSLNYQRS